MIIFNIIYILKIFIIKILNNILKINKTKLKFKKI